MIYLSTNLGTESGMLVYLSVMGFILCSVVSTHDQPSYPNKHVYHLFVFGGRGSPLNPETRSIANDMEKTYLVVFNPFLLLGNTCLDLLL